MEWNGGDPSVGVAELLVRPSLADLDEAESLQNRYHLPRLEDRDVAHFRRP
jgi:hypothetical protein